MGLSFRGGGEKGLIGGTERGVISTRKGDGRGEAAGDICGTDRLHSVMATASDDASLQRD